MPEDIRLIIAHYFIMKTFNKRWLQQIAPNDLFNIEFEYFMKLYKDF